jgi:hypothetical protein
MQRHEQAGVVEHDGFVERLAEDERAELAVAARERVLPISRGQGAA